MAALSALHTVELAADPELRTSLRNRMLALAVLLGHPEPRAVRAATSLSELLRRASPGDRAEFFLRPGPPPELRIALRLARPGSGTPDVCRGFDAVETSGEGGRTVRLRLVGAGDLGREDLRRRAEEILATPTRSELLRTLEERNRRLEEAARLKSEFLANVSHELRTPLNAILGFTARVLKKAGAALPEQQRRNLHTVERNARHLLSMINSLLDFSKLEAGRLEVDRQPVQVAELVGEVVELMSPLAQDKGLALQAGLPESPPCLHTDRDRLRQILVNLVGNAIKFTESGSVRIEVECLEEAVEIAVVDTGIGIPEESLDLIFEPFRQVDGSHTRKAGGTGLGLSITRELAELLGGEVRARSRPGAGSLFAVRLPYRAPGRSSAEQPDPAEGEA